jgi:hypothetical protein
MHDQLKNTTEWYVQTDTWHFFRLQSESQHLRD